MEASTLDTSPAAYNALSKSAPHEAVSPGFPRLLTHTAPMGTSRGGGGRAKTNRVSQSALLRPAGRRREMACNAKEDDDDNDNDNDEEESPVVKSLRITPQKRLTRSDGRSHSRTLCDCNVYADTKGDGPAACDPKPRRFSRQFHEYHQSQAQHMSMPMPSQYALRSGAPPRRGRVGHSYVSRRHHRRRGFGAAAVEAIRKRVAAEESVPPSPTSRSRKGVQPQHQPTTAAAAARGCSRCEAETRAPSHVQFPAPRAKSVHFTSRDEDAGVLLRSVVESDSGSTADAEASGTAGIRLVNIAPFYECAIQQLIAECERRVANTAARSGAVAATQAHPYFSVSTHSFDSLTASGHGAAGNSHGTLQPLSPALTPLSALETPAACRPFDFTANANGLDAAAYGRSGYARGDGMRSNDLQYNLYEGGLWGHSKVFPILLEEAGEHGVNVDTCATTTVQQLIESISPYVAHAEAGPMVLIGALVYLSRITLQCTSKHASMTSANWYRLTTIAILIATKMYVDGGARHWNEYFASAAGLTLKDVGKLELDFLFLIDFDLLIREEEVEAWAEWMEFVARRRDMATPLRTFLLGRSDSWTPSCMTTPMSSYAGEDNFICSFNNNINMSSTCPSTPVSMTPANTTPQSHPPAYPYMHGSPAISKSAARALPPPALSFALDSMEKLPRAITSFPGQMPPSPVPYDMPRFSVFPPSPLPLPSAPWRSERLFSTVHAPLEPATPPSIRQLVMLDTGSLPLTPLEQQSMSPIGFFRRPTASLREPSNSSQRHSHANGHSHSYGDTAECVAARRGGGAAPLLEATRRPVSDDEPQPAQKAIPGALWPPGRRSPERPHQPAPPLATRPQRVVPGGNGKSEGVCPADTAVRAAPKSVYKADKSCAGTASNGRGKQGVSRVLGGTHSHGRSASQNSTDVISGDKVTKEDDDKSTDDSTDVSSQDDGFEDDFDDEDDIFARCHRLQTHSPP